MTTVRMWSGREARALREAKRMTVREFAAHLGVSERTVSKWEAGAGDICPRPEMQAALDTALEQSAEDVKARFLQALGDVRVPATSPQNGFIVQSHKFIPVYIGAEAAAHLAGRRSFGVQMESWLDCRGQPLIHPDGRSALYVFACGVAVVHIRQTCEMGYISDLGAWRYRAAEGDRQWAAQHLAALLGAAHPMPAPPEYVQSLYWLEQSIWSDTELETALRLMSMPSVLVDRDDPAGPRPVNGLVEQWQLATTFDHPDITPFGVRGVSIGYASWAGRSYFPLAPRRALTVDDLIGCELTVQMLWCYSRWIQREAEEGREPGIPDDYGWRFLRGARSRLTSPRSGDTLQHSLMREAVLRATGLPERLRQAQELLREEAVRQAG